jgi:hypothetical protein
MDIDVNSPEVQAILAAEAEKIRAKLESEYSGLKTNRDTILAEKKQLAEEISSLKTQFEGLDIVQVRDMMERVNKDEHAKLVAEGKWEEVLTKRTEMMRRDYDTRLSGAEQELLKHKAEVENLISDKKKYMVETKIREVASKYIHPEMLKFLQEEARSVFRLEDDGEVVARSSEGTLLLGRDGKSPMSIDEWTLMQQDKYPYIFRQSSGAGTQQNSGKGGKGGVKFKEDLYTPAAKAKFIGDHGIESYLALANKK